MDSGTAVPVVPILLVLAGALFLAASIPPAREILGRAPGELLGQDMTGLVVPDDRARIEDAFRRLLSGGRKAIEETFGALRKDGTVADIGAHAVLATLRGKRAILGIAQDIGERRRAQQEIDRYIARLESTVLGTLQAVSMMVGRSEWRGRQPRTCRARSLVATRTGGSPGRRGASRPGTRRSATRPSKALVVVSRTSTISAASPALIIQVVPATLS